MKRYAAFKGECYYPCGGWDDYHRSFETLAEAEAWADGMKGNSDWWHVVDLEEGKIIFQ